jgi:phosphate/sulfate permease
MAPSKPFRLAQVLLTLSVFEFFGPIVRDTSVTHIFNPAWVGHARFHLAWALVFMGLSGLCNLYLIWFRRPHAISNLYLFGFWGAAILERSYGGSIVDPEFHLRILGLNENVFAFVVLTAILFVSLAYLKLKVEPSISVEASA